jgi:Enoyl-CoA hydratase/isomerase
VPSVSILTLNRPEKLNALSNELISAILNALDGIELDHAIRAIVVTGMGRAFSSGDRGGCICQHRPDPRRSGGCGGIPGETPPDIPRPITRIRMPQDTAPVV